MAKSKRPKAPSGSGITWEAYSNKQIPLIVSPVPRSERDRCPLLSKPEHEELVARCQQLEKRVFPKSEAMDLGGELRKPNQYLFVVVKRDLVKDPSHTVLMAYGVLALSKIDRTARISKVCTDPAFRRQGAGNLLVQSMLTCLGHDCNSTDSTLIDRSALADGSLLPYSQLLRGGSSVMEITSIQLHVDKARDEAIRLYRRCGFTVKTEIKDYYAEGRDALLMAVHFS
ncbi:hypothetical protein GGI12_003537 [Dipsacomyces acuminosporus]|nr:hypothetical protein GGI12_003537 [Dipsacomyces acuminosporus]